MVVKKKKASKKAALIVADEAFDPIQRERAAALKAWRKDKAKELDIAAFMIFSDKTLRQLAVVCPRTTEELQQVHGFGEIKSENVLDRFQNHSQIPVMLPP